MLGVAVLAMVVVASEGLAAPISGTPQKAAISALVAEHGGAHQARIEKGVEQVAQLWREADGDAEAFEAFVLEHFQSEPEALQATFEHFEYAFEILDGHLTSIARELRHYMDEDVGIIRPVDRLLGGYDAFAHLTDDMFENRIAFVALLNFPRSSLDQRLEEGPNWTRQQWAQARLVDQFTSRVPAHANQGLTTASAAADAYIADYNIHMHNVIGADGRRLFPEGLRLITHWNLRDELKAHYASNSPDALEKQRTVYHILDAIVRQTIPAAVIDNPMVDWNLATNTVMPTSVEAAQASGKAATSDNTREQDTRYLQLLNIFHAMQVIDEYRSDMPNAVDRAWEEGREIREADAEKVFLSLFEGPVAAKVATLIESRLGRPLEPFDIWYAGFKARADYEEAELDAITKAKYPTPQAFQADIPRILGALGFAAAKASFLASHIEVDPSRGAGHAYGAQRRDDKAHLRTRVGADGMDYKGYNIAVHELGHNVEQVFSLNTIDHTLLEGVPNTAFTEALAFVFQGRDLELLGLASSGDDQHHMNALEEFWAACEIAAVGLVDTAVWHWLYEHPDATAAELRVATVEIAEDVWSKTFDPLMGGQSSALLACYSHMLAYPLYLPNYGLGHLIAFQLEEHFRNADLAGEYERVCQQGRITPDLWMQGAVGARLSAQPLIMAADAAVEAMSRQSGR
jgi:hypothetical protein